MMTITHIGLKKYLGMSGSLKMESDLDLIDLKHGRIKKANLLKLAETLEIPLNQIVEMLPVSLRTIQRYKNTDSLDSDVADHLLLMTQIIERGVQVFGEKKKFLMWLKSPNMALNNRKPIDITESLIGFQLVLNELTRIEYGVYS